MTNDLTIAGLDPNNISALADMFGGGVSNDDLSSGVSASFPVLSFKGKVWRVKHKGEEKTVLNDEGDPISSLSAVLVQASPQISKLYYEKKYAEGDDAAPTCFSLDGIKPDKSSEKIQSETCATCPHNVWGSRVTENGNKTKACADNRRVAVVPYPDLTNNNDGPMLLRVPPASLASLVALRDQLEQLKLPYQAVVVKMGFDNELAFPKLVFKPVRALDINEAKQVREMMESDQVKRMFSEVVDEGSEPKSQPEPAPAPKPKKNPEPAPAPEPEPEPETASNPEPEPEPKSSKQEAADPGTVEDDDDIDSLIGNVLGS